jgi:hypothetical protein
MGVVTWKNIAPSNPAGILSAANAAAQAMGEGFSGVGTALQGGVDKKVQSETDDFISDLMSLETQAERDAMIGEAETAWLNIDTINKTNYELGAPDREMKKFEEQLAAEQISAFARLKEENRLKKDYWSHQVQNPKPTTGSGSGSSKNKFNPKDNNPFKGGQDAVFKYQKGKFGFGSGIGYNDENHYNQAINSFLSATDSQDNSIIDKDANNKPLITAWHINELANQRLLLFDDRLSFGTEDDHILGRPDAFVFVGVDGKSYDFRADGEDPKANAALVELIYDRILETDSPTQITERLYQEDFYKANPKIKTSNQGYKIFKEIYDANIKNKKYHSEVRAKEVFGSALDQDIIDELILKTTGTPEEKAFAVVEKDIAKWDIEMVKKRLNSLESQIKFGGTLPDYQQMQIKALKARLANEKK